MERREALITGVVLALTSAVIVLIVAAGIRADGGRVQQVDGPAGGAEPSDPRPEPTDPSDPAEPQTGEIPGLERFVTDAVAFVEATRGREFISEPDVVALSDAEFTARLDTDLVEGFADDPELVEVANTVYRATGLIGPDEDIDEVYRAFGSAGVLGFYDPTDDELVVRQVDELSLLTQATIVHELTHAFDDQHFDLDRPEYDDRTDEVPWTFRAVLEGSATWVESQWRSRLDATDRAALLAEELAFGDPAMFGRFELSFLLYELSPYQYGEPFVAHVVDTGGQDALDDVLLDPPPTSEQIIDPSRFDAAEPAAPVTAPDADGDPVFEGAGGLALIDALFQGDGIFGSVEWGGDQMVVWEDGERSCLRWLIRSDSATGTEPLANRFEQWADAVGNTTISEPEGDTVQVDRCA